MEAYEDATDEELVQTARAGDDRAVDVLLRRHRRLVRARTASYYLAGGEPDDLVQEGMIGLYQAVLEYDPRAGARFRTFADLCVSRQLATALKAANRHKHRPLNDYVSLHRPISRDEEDGDTLADVLPTAAHVDPAEQVIVRERVHDLRGYVDTALTHLEVEVLRMHLDGRSYREIARVLRRHAKSVDNALQRIKRKLDARLRTWETAAA